MIVHDVNSLVLIVATFPALLQGPSAHTFTEGVPQVVILVFSLFGVAGLVSAYGAWNGQKWGVVLTILLEALPGVLFAPAEFGRISSTIGVLIALFVIYALLRGWRTVSPVGEGVGQ